MTASKRVLVKSYFFPEDKELTQANADKIGLSLSEYIRRISIGTRLPQAGHAKAVEDLLKINADMARLGNLLKMALDEEKTLDLISLIDKIRETQNMLKSKIKDL